MHAAKHGRSFPCHHAPRHAIWVELHVLAWLRCVVVFGAVVPRQILLWYGGRMLHGICYYPPRPPFICGHFTDKTNSSVRGAVLLVLVVVSWCWVCWWVTLLLLFRVSVLGWCWVLMSGHSSISGIFLINALCRSLDFVACFCFCVLIRVKKKRRDSQAVFLLCFARCLAADLLTRIQDTTRTGVRSPRYVGRNPRQLLRPEFKSHHPRFILSRNATRVL